MKANSLLPPPSSPLGSVIDEILLWAHVLNIYFFILPNLFPILRLASILNSFCGRLRLVDRWYMSMVISIWSESDGGRLGCRVLIVLDTKPGPANHIIVHISTRSRREGRAWSQHETVNSVESGILGRGSTQPIYNEYTKLRYLQSQPYGSLMKLRWQRAISCPLSFLRVRRSRRTSLQPPFQ